MTDGDNEDAAQVQCGKIAEECALCRLQGVGFLLLVAVLAPLLTGNGWLTFALAPCDAFQRSGAITSVFALLSGVMLSKYRADFEGIGYAGHHQKNAFTKYLSLYRAMSYVSIGLSVIGSLIWGYGDLWFK